MTLFWQYFRANLRGLLIWIGAGLLLVLGLTRSAPAVVNGGMEAFQKLPEQFQRLLGLHPALSSLDNYVAGKVALSTVLLLVIYAVILGLSAITREVDRRTIDFLLSLPVTRRQVLLGRLAVLVVNTALLGFVLWGAIILDLQAQGLPGGAWAAYWLLALVQWLVALMVGAITLLLSLWIDDYSLAIKLFMGATSALYFLELVMKAAGVGRWGRFWSPFSYADPVEILVTRSIPVADLFILLTITCAAVAASLPVFDRKQITL